MPEKPSKENRLSLLILSILFLVSLIYAVYDLYKPFQFKKEVTESKNDIPEYFDYGIIADSVYCNDFFNFRIPILEGYQGNYKKYDYIEKNIYERDSVPAAPRLSSTIRNLNLLLISPELKKLDLTQVLEGEGTIDDYFEYYSEKQKRESVGSDYQLVFRVHRLGDESLGAYMNRFDNLHHPDYGEPRSELISGIEFQKYVGKEIQGGAIQESMFQMVGGKNRNIVSYFREIKGFALSIDIFYLTEEQKDILLEMVHTISFH